MQTAPFPQLQIFLAVARLRSFSSAAREFGVSTSAISQAVKQLEEQLRVTLLTRTTRSVFPTDAGKLLLETAGPSLDAVISALAAVSAKPGEVVGRVKLSVERLAISMVLQPMMATFRERHPKIELEIVVEERLVDIVGEGYDAAVRLSEAIDRDMVQLRLSDELRFVVVGAPSYLARNGAPRKPEDLLRHDCNTFRVSATGASYAWEFERGKRTWRVPVRGGIVANEPDLCVAAAEAGVGLAYTLESRVADQVRTGQLAVVLEGYAPTVPGWFLAYPSRAQSSAALRLFVDVAKEVFRRPSRA